VSGGIQVERLDFVVVTPDIARAKTLYGETLGLPGGREESR
jgi:extradiol dioxygenase family protein